MVVLYGEETWALTLKQENLMKSCEYMMFRYKMRVSWRDKVINTEVLEKKKGRKIQYL